MTLCIGAMTICEKRIPIHFASFATVELIDSDLNITAEAFELCLFSFAESFFDLILVHRHHTDEKLIRVMKITGLNRLVHELVQLIGKLNGDLGHDGLIVSRLARLVEGLIQRREPSDKPVVVRNRAAVQREPPDPDVKTIPIQARLPKVGEKCPAAKRSRAAFARLSHTSGMRP